MGWSVGQRPACVNSGPRHEKDAVAGRIYAFGLGDGAVAGGVETRRNGCSMRSLLVSLVALALAAPAEAATLEGGGTPNNTIFQWIEAYSDKPKPNAAPKAVKDMSQYGAFRNPEGAGFYVGFIAGVLGANPKNAAKLAGKMLPLPPEDDWVIVRAVAWSGLPEWKSLLSSLRQKVPAREAMIDKYIAGEMPTLFEATVVPPPPASGWKAVFKKKKKDEQPLPSADELDALWGYYLATGSEEPLDGIIAFLPLADESDHVERLAIGGMAKYMLASAAVRDPELLAMLKGALPRQDKKTAKELTDVIDAAESVDAGRIRAEQVAALDELKLRGPDSRRKVAKWGKIGEGAISLGCVAAAATGQVYLGIPCVVGGAATSAALRYWASRE